MTVGAVRLVMAMSLLTISIGTPSPALAVRGIDAPHEVRVPKLCPEVLRDQIERGRIKKNDEIAVRLSSGEEVAGRFAGMMGGVSIALTRGASPELVSPALDEITGVTVRRHRLRPLWMIGGLVVGGAIGGFALNSRCDDTTGTAECLLVTTAGVAGGGAAGLLLGTLVPWLVPKDVTLDCQ